jgi:sugar O-acyltransferase (sialic acid O-acetyltransferase NeuD family)
MVSGGDEATPSGAYLIGAGGHGKVVADALLAGGVRMLGVFDDAPSKAGLTFAGMEVGFPTPTAPPHDRAQAHVAIGTPAHRSALVRRLSSAGWILPPIVHPRAHVSAGAKLGMAVFVAAGAVIGPDTAVEDGAIVNHNAVIDHDCVVGAFAHVGPGAVMCGGARIGRFALLGAGSIVLPGKSAADHCIIGAGSVVSRCLVDAGVYVGAPVRLQHELGAPKATSETK